MVLNCLYNHLSSSSFLVVDSSYSLSKKYWFIRGVQWLQDNRQSYEAEDARARTRGGVYYSPPGTSYTIVERPASSHGHHSYSQHYSGKLSRTPYLGSTTIANSAGD